MTNAGQEVWFRKSDGHEVSCNEGTVAFDLMEKDGSFERLDAQGGEPFVYTLEDAIAQNNGVDESTEAKAKAAKAKTSKAKKVDE